MTQRTMEEAIDVLTSLDEGMLQCFVDWHNNEKSSEQSETDHEFYNDLYGPIAAAHFTDFDEDEDEITGPHFWQPVAVASGLGDPYVSFGKIVDETGF